MPGEIPPQGEKVMFPVRISEIININEGAVSSPPHSLIIFLINR